MNKNFTTSNVIRLILREWNNIRISPKHGAIDRKFVIQVDISSYSLTLEVFYALVFADRFHFSFARVEDRLKLQENIPEGSYEFANGRWSDGKNFV